MGLPCDWAFGPRVDTACRAFDFTLYFEDLFLVTLPNALFLLLLPLPLCSLVKSRNAVKGSRLFASKAAAYCCLFICQIALLVLRLGDGVLWTRASLAADALSLIAVAGAVLLSWLQHHRSERPSTLLAILLAALALVDIARARTLWLIPGVTGAAAVLTLILGSTLFALLFESLGKRGNLSKPEAFAASGPEPFVGFWNLAAFTWLLGTLRQGYRQILSVEDLPALDYRIDSHVIHRKLQTTLTKYDTTKRHSLLKACFHAYASAFLGAVVPRLFLTGFTFSQPFLIQSLVDYIDNRQAPVDYGKGIVGAYALVYLGLATSTAVYWYHTFRFLIRLRGGLISIIHRRTVRMRAADKEEIDGLTLMGTDVERIVAGFRSIHEVWASLVDIAVAIYLLNRQVYVACLVPAVIVLAFVLATFWLSAWAKVSQKLWIEKVEERLGVTTSTLGAMRAVKMLGLSGKIFDIITAFRLDEINISHKFRKLLIVKIFFSNSPRVLAPLVTFVVFVALAHAKKDGTLLASQAFTSLSLIALLTTPALTFIQAIPSMIQCIGCFDRIQDYCKASQGEEQRQQEEQQVIEEGSMVRLKDIVPGAGSPVVSFYDQSFAWTKTGTAVLHSVTVKIMAGRITAVVGSTGSGKSTLLESMLGETVALGGGRVKRSFVTAAYCSQVPWLTNGSIRDNIIGRTEEPFDEKWYTTVLWSCGLDEDLASLAQGDRTLVGNGGGQLSGGQRQRVSLARAVYSRCSLMLLDDVFSGVDNRNIHLIAERLLGPKGLLRQSMTTVVLVAHAASLISLANDMIIIENGKIKESCPIRSLPGVEGYLTAPDVNTSSDPDPSRAPPSRGGPAEPNRSQPVQETPDLPDRSSATGPNLQDGDFSVYRYYAKAAGYGTVAAFFAAELLWAFCDEFSVVVVDWWSSANAKNPHHSDRNDGIYLGAYAVLAIASPVFMTIACWILFIKILSNTAKNLHDDLLKTILGASLRFFQETDVGSITNRFSQDLELIGMDLPITAANYAATACECACKAVLLAVFAKYLSAILPLLVASVFFIQRFYLRTSRQVRLLDIEAKAPVYLLFLETAAGASSLRAFGWQQAFDKTLQSLLDWSQRPVYVLYCIQQWLALVMDLIVAALAVVLVAIIVTWRDSFGPGAVGVSLVTVMTFSSTLTRLVTYWAALETSVGAVGRIKAFVENTASEEHELAISPLQTAPPHWPTQGAITYRNVIASYRLNSPPALNSISLSIKPGQKVAICGRSGSGKTSFILSLLHMINFQGSITIDGIETSQLPPVDLCSRINVVPQEPFLMPGSVRFNIDPFGHVPDHDIVTALQRLRLWDRIIALGGLDSHTSFSSWSVGERQLLCLARAMVRKAHILVLDEAASSVDPLTESIMQAVIDTYFASHTVLAVVHRLQYIHRFDQVAVLQRGHLVEYDTPTTLLSTSSVLADMYNAGK